VGPEGRVISDNRITVDDRLTALFKHGLLRDWHIDDIRRDKLMRFAQAYLMLAKAKYRPFAPSDRMGNVTLSAARLKDPRQLHREAVEYAIKFQEEEDCDKFWVGCSNFTTNRAFVLPIEVARLLAGGDANNRRAVKLLRMALGEIEDQKQKS
jgi:hypothetical protein